MANVTVTIRTEDTAAAPIDGVAVQVFDVTGLLFVTSGVSGATVPGQVDLTLLGDAGGVGYTVRLFKAGVSFLPEPKFSITVKDPPVPPNSFTFVGTLGLQGILVTFAVQDDALPTPGPVEGARVRLFDSADIFLAEMSTDSAGEAEVVLAGAVSPGLNYIVRLFKSGSTVQGGPTQTVKVIDPLGPSETNVFDFVLIESTVAESLDPDMCRLSGYFSDPSLRGIKDLTLIFHPREGYPDNVVSGLNFSGDPTIVRDRIISSERQAKTDPDGRLEIDLPRESVFDVYVQGHDAADLKLLSSIFVPDLAGIAVEDVFFPYITKVTYSTASVVVAVNTTEEVGLVLESSNLQPDLEGKGVVEALLDFTVDDEDIAEVTVTDEGNLAVRGLVAGVTNLQVDRVVGTVAPRRPVLADIVVSPASLTITVT